MSEFEERLTSEQDRVRKEFENQRQSLQEALGQEQQRLKEEHERKLNEQLEAMRAQESQEYERKRQRMLQELTQEFETKYRTQLEEEKKIILSESERILTSEKERLRLEYEDLLKQERDQLQSSRAGIRSQMEQYFLQRLEQVAQEYDHKMELLGTRVPQTREEKLALYRDRMRQSYGTGLPTVEAAKRLMELKELLELSFDDHLSVESDVRLDLYVENVERLIFLGEINVRDQGKLDEIKQRFRIVPDEAARLEPYILSSIQRLAVKGKILIVDDDPSIVDALETDLTSRGYQVITALDVATALSKVQNTSVDLILSDVKFPEGDLDGFKFFGNVQAIAHLRRIPFIFMSAIQDGVIIRYGIQLGVDDYITKPLDLELLAAVIDGKLKRYRNFGKP